MTDTTTDTATTTPDHITITDILKSEDNLQSRIAIDAPKGTKIGEFVDYGVRKQKLVALTDEIHGKVCVQPFNCIICLDKLTLPTGVTKDKLIKEGDAFGILYEGTPKVATVASSV